jgi:hypothetical protein
MELKVVAKGIGTGKRDMAAARGRLFFHLKTLRNSCRKAIYL